MAGLRKPLSGAIRINNEAILPPAKYRVGYVPQDLALFPHLSVRKNLLYGHDIAASSPGITLDHVAQVLEIAPLLDRSIAQLSGGQKQRVAFAVHSSPRPACC